MSSDSRLEVFATGAKCKNCGSDLRFDPHSQSLLCDSCQSTFDITKVLNTPKNDLYEDEDNKSYNSWVQSTKFVKCGNCGAEVPLEKLDITEHCPYCDSAYVLEKESIPGIQPDCIIPFAFTKKEAIEKFAAGMKKKFFAPSALKKKLPESEIHGLYIPSFAFDSDTYSRYDGVIVIAHHHHNGKKSYTTYEHKHISGTESVYFRDLSIEASSQIEQKQLESILPYGMDLSCEYNPDLLRGFSVEHYIDSMSTCSSGAHEKMKAKIKASILSHYHYDSVERLSVSTNYSNELYTYRMLPIYFFEYTFNGKKYKTIVNGQTGKVGSGTPISGLKVTLVVFIILIILAILVYLYMNFGESDYYNMAMSLQ